MPIPSPTALAWLRFALLQPPATAVKQLVEAAAAPPPCEPPAEWLDRSLAWLQRDDALLVTPCDATYPARLREIPDPPPVLFARGRIELLASPSVAIIGSRNATRQGIADALAFSRALSEAGLAVVSGLAKGIDAAAHEGALLGGAGTIAVMGTGPDVVYPRANADLHARIVQEGCVITEFAPGTPPLGRHFPQRNRLISGLSMGVLVVEAAVKSGTLGTAREAGRQGRDVYAMPGSIHSPHVKGCHALIRQGASLVDSVDDLLGDLGYGQFARGPQPPEDLEALGADERAVLRAVGYAAASPDEVAVSTGFAIGRVMAQLARLQLAERIEALAGGRFRRLAKSRTPHVIE